MVMVKYTSSISKTYIVLVMCTILKTHLCQDFFFPLEDRIIQRVFQYVRLSLNSEDIVSLKLTVLASNRCIDHRSNCSLTGCIFPGIFQSPQRTKQDVVSFIVSQDDEGAHRGRRTVMERKASSHPHRSSVRQTETSPENLSQCCTAEPYTGTERHHKQITNKQTR